MLAFEWRLVLEAARVMCHFNRTAIKVSTIRDIAPAVWTVNSRFKSDLLGLTFDVGLAHDSAIFIYFS